MSDFIEVNKALITPTSKLAIEDNADTGFLQAWSKLHTGDTDTDDGAVTEYNPLPVRQYGTFDLLQAAREEHPGVNPTASLPTGFSTGSKASVTQGALNTLGTYVVPMGRCWILEEVTVCAGSALGDIVVNLGILSQETGQYQSDEENNYKLIPAAGGQARWEWRQGKIVPELSALQIKYAVSASGSNNAPFISVGMSYHDVTMDLRTDARYMILGIGDSIGWTIPEFSTITPNNTGDQLWMHQIKNNLKDKGASVRIVNKSTGGCKATDLFYRIAHGHFDVPYDLMLLSLGMNDASLAVSSQNAYIAALNAFITHRDRNRPHADILLCAPSSTDDPMRNYTLIRQGTAQAVSSSTITLDSGASAVDNFYQGNLVVVNTSGNTSALDPAPIAIASGVGSTKVQTLASNWPVTPTGTVTFAVLNQTLPNPTVIGSVRAWAQSVVTNYSKPSHVTGNLIYVDLSQAFAANADTNFVTTQYGVNSGLGNRYLRVHPNAAGHLLLSAYVGANGVVNTNFYQNTLRLNGVAW